ncbi:NAD(P)H-binding protein [Lacticaseibacillus sp. GG6-2]
MTKVGIIGATGVAGQALVQEALAQNLETTAIIRNAAKGKDLFQDKVNYLIKDAFALKKADLENFDVIIDAFSPSELASAYQHIDLATKLVAFFRTQDTPRLFFILGAGSLKNGKGGHVFDDLLKDPSAQSWIEAPRQQFKEFDFLSEVDNVNWVAVSPGIIFKPGEARQALVGEDTVLYNAEGKSETSSGTLAKEIINEIQTPKHDHVRYEVIDA